MGVLGLGRIGREVARKARGVGLKVLAHDPYLQPDQAAGAGRGVGRPGGTAAPFGLPQHSLPADQGNPPHARGGQLAQMKPSAFLINMARGPVVDQPALYHALVNGIIAGAAVDVLEQEPPDPNDPLLRLPNMLVTPHSSSASTESVVQLRRGVARNVSWSCGVIRHARWSTRKLCAERPAGKAEGNLRALPTDTCGHPRIMARSGALSAGPGRRGTRSR